MNEQTKQTITDILDRHKLPKKMFAWDLSIPDVTNHPTLYSGDTINWKIVRIFFYEHDLPAVRKLASFGRSAGVSATLWGVDPWEIDPVTKEPLICECGEPQLTKQICRRCTKCGRLPRKDT